MCCCGICTVLNFALHHLLHSRQCTHSLTHAQSPTKSQFHEQTLIAGQEGTECALWSFLPPNARASGDDAHAVEGDGGRGAGGRGSKKDKSAKKERTGSKKEKGRFPKRTTR